MNENMSRLLPRLLADKEYFEMKQGLLEFRLQSDLASTQKNKMEKYHLGVRVEKNTFRLAVQCKLISV